MFWDFLSRLLPPRSLRDDAIDAVRQECGQGCDYPMCCGENCAVMARRARNTSLVLAGEIADLESERAEA